MTEKPSNDSALRGQKYAYATASLIAGLACFVNLLGVEKALLAILFGALALGAPALQPRRSWAKAGLILGLLQIVAVGIALVLFRTKLAELIDYLSKFG